MTEPPAFLTTPPPHDQIAARAGAIYDAVLRRSRHITAGNFTACSADDLRLLFALYDERFFGGAVGGLVQASGAPLTFSFSPRLTSSAGLTKRFARRGDDRPSRFEIVLSSPLLYQTFTDVSRTVTVNGVECRDRLEAAQRVFEHELLHLIEMLVWGGSSCDAPRYKGLALGWFAHTETKHDLVTQRERARARFDVRVGDRVAFTFEGSPYAGVVNRITRRATVLVESARGEAYTDGKRYLKFYIPLGELRKLTAGEEGASAGRPAGPAAP